MPDISKICIITSGENNNEEFDISQFMNPPEETNEENNVSKD